jgi:hypothetical protein
MMLTGILLIASALRLLSLSDIPPGLYFDESANGVDAMRVLGGWHPVFFPGDQGREPLVIYLQAATMWLIGPSPMALRLPSAVLGVLTVAATYATFRAFAGRLVGLIGASLLAGSFWHVMLSRHAFRTDSLPLFMAIAGFWFYKGIRTGSRIAFVIGGAALGTSLYTYIPARLAPPLFFAWLVGCVLIPGWRPGVAAKQILAGIGLGGVTCGLVALPLALYFYRHPGDFAQRLRTASGSAAGVSIVTGLKSSLSALFVSGDPLQRHDLTGRPLLDVAVSIAGLVGVIVAARYLRKSPYIFVFLWCVVMVFPAALSGEPAHALRLVGELPYVLLFPALALAGLAESRLISTHAVGAAAVVVILTAGALATARDYFVVWANRPITYDVFQGDLLHPLSLLSQVPRDAPILATSDVYEGAVLPESFVPLAQGRVRAFNGLNTFVLPPDSPTSVYYLYSRTFVPPTGIPLATRVNPIATAIDPFGRIDGQLFRIDPHDFALPPDRSVGAFIGSAIEATGVDFRTTARPGENATYALHWTVRGDLPPGNWEFFAHLVERGRDRRIAEGYNHGFSPDQWRVGDRVVSRFELPIPVDVPEAIADLNFGLFDIDTGQRVPVFTPAREPAGGAVVVGPVRITGPQLNLPAPSHPTRIRFGSALTLDGYDVNASTSGLVMVRLHWHADARVSSDYTAFVHLLDAQGRFLVGADSQPGNGRYPTSTWQVDDSFVDDHTLAAPSGVKAAGIEIGMYLLATGQRLPVVDLDTRGSLGDAVRYPW